jgi:hypothetical protein
VVGGPGVESEDKVEWKASKDCHGSDEDIQVMKIDWFYKR